MWKPRTEWSQRLALSSTGILRISMEGQTLAGTPTSTRGSGEAWIKVTDYESDRGWVGPGGGDERSRWCCHQLEEGRILFFERVPFDFPESDRQFLLGQRQSDGRVHKNISYRPRQDVLRGSASGSREDTARLHRILRHYSEEVTNFMTRLLAPYAKEWSLDFASFRPVEESGRNLPLHKRNDLLHVDAFPSRPTRGNRILRCFTNVNPTQPRIWLTTDRFSTLAKEFARAAGLENFARRNGGNTWLNSLKRLAGLKGADRSAYDEFMLHFHDYLKENSGFQERCPKIRIAFPPLSTWICFTDSVPHAVLSGQYAMEQTFIIPLCALLAPEKSPIRVLEQLAGRPLAPETARQAA
jgi:3-deoxy-D-manno-oct-2-ulosonic acid (Kdo) hydroxylase